MLKNFLLSLLLFFSGFLLYVLTFNFSFHEVSFDKKNYFRFNLTYFIDHLIAVALNFNIPYNPKKSDRKLKHV